MKEINSHITDEFQTWHRKYLPSNLVIQNVDGWVLVISVPPTFEPHALLELKRSFIIPGLWKPYKEDLPNYKSLFRLAERARLPSYIIYYRKGEEITDKTMIGIFKITGVDDDIHYDEIIVTGLELRTRFFQIIK